jgi:SAM-dependent methyltransferase
MGAYENTERARPSELLSMVEGQESYVRERLQPGPEDPNYLHLSDLLIGLRKVASASKLRVLDYGAGVSPYRALFPHAEYERADIADVAGAKYVLGADGSLSAPSRLFDLVLSTQVLEHVQNPQLYLAECHRVLRSEGILALSTHGLFEDHGCPYDFQRWTADGLRRDVLGAGFAMLEVYKLTTGTRAMSFLLQRWARTSTRTPGTLVNRMLRRRVVRTMHRSLDRRFPDCRVVESATTGHDMYIALLVIARKP